MAPTAWSSGGRSAVRTMSGVREYEASTTAAWNSAAAVPDVESTTAGLPVALPMPRAKKEPHRSSIWTRTLIRG